MWRNQALRRTRRALTRALVGAVSIVGLVVTALGMGYVARAERRTADGREAAATSDLVASLASALGRSVDLLYTTRTLVQHDIDGIDESDFEGFFDGLDLAGHRVDVFGAGTIVRLRPGEEDAFLSSRGMTRANLGPDYAHCFIEHTTSFEQALPSEAYTLDLCATDPIAPVLDASMNEATVTALPLTGITPTADQYQEFLLFLPMYRGGTVPSTIAVRRSEATGWAVVMLRSSTLLADALGAGARAYAVRLSALTPPGRIPVGEWRPASVSDRPWTTHRIATNGLAWELQLRAPARRVEVADSVLPVGIGGAVMTLLLTALAWMLLRGRDLALRRADAAARKVECSEQRFRMLATSSPVGIIEYGADGDCRFVNTRFREITGLTVDDMNGGKWFDAIHPDDRARVQDVVAREGDRTTEFRIVSADGRVRWVRSKHRVLRDQDGATSGSVAIVEDITAMVEANDALAYQARHDALTDLPNRTLLLERLGDALASRDRHGGVVAVLFLDLDRFKLVNDSHGHDAGDALLVEVASRLRRHVRHGETLARLSGDEFVLLLPRVASEDEALQTADRLATTLGAPIRVGDAETFVTASIGIVVIDEPVDGTDAVLRDADAAMYRAKERGRARAAVFHESFRDAARARLGMSDALRGALARGEIEVHYQPQIDLRTDEVIGAEALVRWRRPGHGLVGPDEFIEIAEDTGLISDLGAWVLHDTLRQVAAWQTSPWGGPGIVSVNVSARQLTSPRFAELVGAVLAEHGVSASSLCLEITESALDERTRAIEVLEELAAVGVRVAIDDFGTGWSSLSRLSDLPVHVLKVDRSFVDGLGRDAGARRITEAVVSLGRSLGLAIVAEGVETEHQEDVLARLGCHAAQGFRWSSPLPADDFEAWCRERASQPGLASGHGSSRS